MFEGVPTGNRQDEEWKWAGNFLRSHAVVMRVLAGNEEEREGERRISFETETWLLPIEIKDRSAGFVVSVVFFWC